MINKRQYNKKKILGLIKTYHAKSRQKERAVTDSKLKEILSKGSYEETYEGDTVVKFQGYLVYITEDPALIKTVVAPEKAPKKIKAFDTGLAEDIKLKLNLSSKSDDSKDSDQMEGDEEVLEMSFDEYMKKHFPK